MTCVWCGAAGCATDAGPHCLRRIEAATRALANDLWLANFIRRTADLFDWLANFIRRTADLFDQIDRQASFYEALDRTNRRLARYASWSDVLRDWHRVDFGDRPRESDAEVLASLGIKPLEEVKP